jgi:predicted short-subunit dehydrogenase-like oxidoreductase (DUF2520 family)
MVRSEAIFVVGAGRVGAALATALARAGATVVGIWSRGEASAGRAGALAGVPAHHGALPAAIARATVVLVPVPDTVVPAVAGELLDGGLLRAARAVLHCSGGIPASQALAPLRSAVPVGTFHPLVAIADPARGAAWLSRCLVALEGEGEALAVGRGLAAVLGARAVELPAEALPLYHAAAVLASNHTVALVAAAADVLAAAGVPEPLEALRPLLRSTVENLESLELADALTGPVRRGDVATIERHLRVLAERSPELVDTYRACTIAAVRLARRLPESSSLLDAVERAVGCSRDR